MIKFPRNKEVLPENCANTEAYIMHEVLYGDSKTKTVPDLITGQDRNRRWGLVMSFTVVPKFEDVPPNQGPTLLPKVPYRFITADSLDELKARANFEIDKALKMAEMSVNDPEGFMKVQTERMKADMEESRDSLENDMS